MSFRASENLGARYLTFSILIIEHVDADWYDLHFEEVLELTLVISIGFPGLHALRKIGRHHEGEGVGALTKGQNVVLEVVDYLWQLQSVSFLLPVNWSTLVSPVDFAAIVSQLEICFQAVCRDCFLSVDLNYPDDGYFRVVRATLVLEIDSDCDTVKLFLCLS